MDMDVRPVASAQDMQGAWAVRVQVFVEEQGVPLEMEQDVFDATATHVIALQSGEVVATGRLLLDETSDQVRLGRMAVTTALRGQGLGAKVLACLEDQARLQGKASVLLHAQTSVRAFYEKFGYIAHGQVFLEAGISHISMRKSL